MKETAAMPTVSVVIPFYSGVSWLCEAVESALEQHVDCCEIIVVNDGSPEDMSGFLRRYGDKINYYEKENEGPAAARNDGIRRARGEFIAFLDADDLWNPQKLRVQTAKMRETGAQWSLTDYELFGEAVTTEYRKVASGGETRFVSTVPPYIATPTVMVRRDLLLKNGFSFCRELRYGQDALLWEQLMHCVPALYLPQSLARVRIRGGNAGRRAAVQIHARVEMYDKCVQLIAGYKESKSALFRLATSLCRFGRRFVRCDVQSRANELAARALFALPYVLYRVDRKRTEGKSL